MSAASVAIVADGPRVKVVPCAVSLTGAGTTVFGNVDAAAGAGAVDFAAAEEAPAAAKPIAVTRATAARARRADVAGFRRVLFMLSRSAQGSGARWVRPPGAMRRTRAAGRRGPVQGTAVPC